MNSLRSLKLKFCRIISYVRVPVEKRGTKWVFIIVPFLISFSLFAKNSINIQPIIQLQIAQKIGQFRSVPVKVDGKNVICGMYSEDAEIDPYIGMFFFPKHTLKLILFDEKGEILWKRDLGEGVVPGVWFSPIYAMDLDKDGNDEIWIINNQDPEHPLDYRKYVLEKIDPKTGNAINQWKWKESVQPQSMSSTFRHFIFGEYVNGEPVLVTAQGTYGEMSIQAWNSDMTQIGKNGEPVVLGVKVGEKIRAAEGESRTGVVEYTYEAISGKKIDLGFNVYTTIPVDLNGDGIHELVKGYFEGDGTVIDNSGKVLGNFGGLTAMASKFTSLPGEQILSYSKDGKITIWADKNAQDSEAAQRRYNHPYYKVNQYQTGNGYNLFTLGGDLGSALICYSLQ